MGERGLLTWFMTNIKHKKIQERSVSLFRLSLVWRSCFFLKIILFLRLSSFLRSSSILWLCLSFRLASMCARHYLLGWLQFWDGLYFLRSQFWGCDQIQYRSTPKIIFFYQNVFGPKILILIQTVVWCNIDQNALKMELDYCVGPTWFNPFSFPLDL